jgi:proteasome lid subunit RPN8/RPN11
MSPFTHITIPDLLLEEVIEHAREAAPLECCGLLAGHICEGGACVTTRFTIGNDARSPTEYETNVRDLFAAFRSIRERGTEVLAIYHSHPTSAPVPSRRDIERNTYGESVVHVIVGLVGAGAEVRAWWLTETGYRAADLHITQI